MPFAVDEIRKLGSSGHDVIAADTFHTAPGSHTRGAAQHRIVPSPKDDTLAFVGEVADVLVNEKVDVLVPMFEEVFYLARHRDLLEPHAELFFPTFDVLSAFHDKASFIALAQRLDVPVPDTVTVTTDDELADAIARFPRYFARAAFSRGGVELLTNTGPLAGVIDPADVHPTAQNPWVVQEFVEGVDLCSFSVVHHGRVVAHCTYEHPKTIEHAGGIEFVSVDEPETLAHVERFVGETGYHGQISFDYLKHDDGVVSMVECNPRPTDGVTLMPADEFNKAVLDPGTDRFVLDAGHRSQIDFALLRDMFREPHNLPSDVRDLFAAPDVYASRHDLKPLLYEILSYSHVFAFRHHEGGPRKHTDLMAAQFYDIEWDGSPIP